MFKKKLILITMSAAVTGIALADNSANKDLANSVEADGALLEKNTDGKGFGPQAPRDLNSKAGLNKRISTTAPSSQKMNLCNIHFHYNAEHKGGDFTTLASQGDAGGYQAGYKYSGKLSAEESTPLKAPVCVGEHGGVQAGDTIELHYVHSTAQVSPGPTLGACLSEADSNPQLRVEAQVFVLVNDVKAPNFENFVKTALVDGYQQAPNIPRTSGTSINYIGSTTGPAYNSKGSPLQVSWSVRPSVVKVNAQSIGEWCKGNIFKEDHAHRARNIVTNTKLLSEIY